MARRPGVLLMFVACAGAPRGEEGARDVAVKTVDVGEVDAAGGRSDAAVEVAGAEGARDLSGPALLGKSRVAIEAVIGAALRTSGGWVEYAGVRLQYRGDRCVGLRRQVPAGLDCGAAARWLGYPDAGAPLYRHDRCEWPGISLRHQLAPGVVGTLMLAGGLFELRLR